MEQAPPVEPGTVMLEAALLDAPVVMIDRLDPLKWIGNDVMRVPDKLPRHALSSMLAAERVVPELVQGEATPARLAAEAQRPLSDETARQRLREGYRRARAALGVPGAPRALAADVCASIASLAHSFAGTARR